MKTATPAPGPAADSAFRLGVLASAILGLAVIWLLTWVGAARDIQLAYLLLVVFPMYLLVVAAVLSAWLGFGKDATSLRPVHRPKDSE